MSEYKELSPKLHAREHETWTQYWFYCPACGETHHYNGLKMNGEPLLWEFNGNVEKPSFTPSLRITGVHRETGQPSCCHLYVTDGAIHFCGDCSHGMSGQTVPMVDMPRTESI